MKLQHCRACGRFASRKSTYCPACGAALRRFTHGEIIAAIVAALILFILLLLALIQLVR